jgi:hypothetical protein
LWNEFFAELNLKGNKLSDKRLLKLVDQCRSKQVLDYMNQHCTRSSTGIDTASGGKGKKSKKGKKEHTDNEHMQENVSNAAN